MVGTCRAWCGIALYVYTYLFNGSIAPAYYYCTVLLLFQVLYSFHSVVFQLWDAASSNSSCPQQTPWHHHRHVSNFDLQWRTSKFVWHLINWSMLLLSIPSCISLQHFTAHTTCCSTSGWDRARDGACWYHNQLCWYGLCCHEGNCYWWEQSAQHGWLCHSRWSWLGSLHSPDKKCETDLTFDVYQQRVIACLVCVWYRTWLITTVW